MKREAFWWTVVVILTALVIVGCALSEDQIRDISTAAAAGAATIAKPVVGVAAPGTPDAGIDAIAATIGAVVGGVVGWLLRTLKKDKPAG